MVDAGSSPTLEEFVAVWDIAGSEYFGAFVTVSALFALTAAGERPVGIDELAATVHRPVSETRALVSSLGEVARIDCQTVHLTLGTSSPSPRFQVRIDDRAIRSGGCAPDLFWIAVCSGKTVRVETSCQASAAAQALDPHPGGRPYRRQWTPNVTMEETMTGTPAAQAVAELSKPGGAFDLGHDRARLAIRLLHLLAYGAPVTRDQVRDAIAELGIDPDQANAQLDAWAERDDNGDIVGFGLTHNPTPHQMTIDGMRLWAWCGMDTLIFTHLLNKPITIESTAPDTDEVIRLVASPSAITDVHPAGAVITQRVPGDDGFDLSTKTGMWSTSCHHNLFFPTHAQAQQWAAGRDDIAVLSLEEGLAAARDMANALLRYEPGRSS